MLFSHVVEPKFKPRPAGSAATLCLHSGNEGAMALLSFFLKIIYLFIYLFLAALDLHCGAQASHCSGFSCCGAQALGAQASVVVVRGLSSCGSRA